MLLFALQQRSSGEGWKRAQTAASVDNNPEKADHVLRECPRLNQLRWECFGALQLTSETEWEVSALCRFLKDDRVSTLEDSGETGGNPPGDYISDDEELR